MKDQDNTNRQFPGMVELEEALQGLPAEIRSHQYEPGLFGSWLAVVHCNGVWLRVIYEGRESQYSLQRWPSEGEAMDWQLTGWQSREEVFRQIPVAALVAEIAKQAGIPQEFDGDAPRRHQT